MALTVKQLVNRHGAFVSAVTGLLVGTAIIVQRIAEYVIGLASASSAPQLPEFPLGNMLLVAVPFAFGFFASLWIIAPIAEELRLPHVVTRAILATGVASTLVFVVLAIAGIVATLAFLDELPGNIPGALASALTGAALTFVSTLPLGVLAGVLLWFWRKEHPPRRPLV